MGRELSDIAQEGASADEQAGGNAPSATSDERNPPEELDGAAPPRDPTVLEELTPEAEGEWDEPPTSAPASAHRHSYRPPEGKRGRKADPTDPVRSPRTYADKKARAAVTGAAADREDARSFGLAMMDAMRARGEYAKADAFGKREGFLVEAAPVSAAAPEVSPVGSSPPAPGAAAPGPATGGEQARTAQTPEPRVHGQPVSRINGALQAVAPAVEALATLAAGCGIDLTQPTTKTFHRNTPFERQVQIVPRDRLAELLAKKLCERAEEAQLVGEGGDEEGETDLELLLLLGTTVGPVALAVGKKVLSTCATGAVALFNLLRSRRK